VSEETATVAEKSIAERNSPEMSQPKPEHPIENLLYQRWSPYVYAPRPVEQDKLQQCLTAASWAASSYNEQPWTFLVARREDEAEFAKMLGCLVEANQQWACNAGVLMLTVIARNFTKNGKPNRVAEHDLGAAACNMALQAAAIGLAVHQMAGVEVSKIRTTYAVPEGYDPMTGIALGYAGDLASADDELAKRDQDRRGRKSLSEIVFSGKWGEKSTLV
jgi:nitroreductase